MRIKSLFVKRNYVLLYNIIKRYPANVKSQVKKYDDYIELSKIIKYFEINKYDKIVVVASGPSSRNIVFDEKALYFTTNAALELVDERDYVYILNDSYYLIKYLKTFKGSNGWKGTIFLYSATKNKEKEYGIKFLYKYFKNKSRSKREFLITNSKIAPSLNSIHEEFIKYIKDKLDIDFYGVNSGFATMAFAFVLSDICNKKIEIYGLDLGEKEEGYFNKKVEVGKSIKGDYAKKNISNFLNKIYMLDNNIKNYSFYKTRI